MMEQHCPYCGSDDLIEWDDGYICRDCGQEFDEERKETDDE